MRDEWDRETRKIREAMDVPEEEQKTPRDALSRFCSTDSESVCDGTSLLSALSAWLSGLFEVDDKSSDLSADCGDTRQDEHAHERGEPYCKMCGKEGIESGDFEEEGVNALLCDDCQDKI
jgi:hypothetical protein